MSRAHLADVRKHKASGIPAGTSSFGYSGTSQSRVDWVCYGRRIYTRNECAEVGITSARGHATLHCIDLLCWHYHRGMRGLSWPCAPAVTDASVKLHMRVIPALACCGAALAASTPRVAAAMCAHGRFIRAMNNNSISIIVPCLVRLYAPVSAPVSRSFQSSMIKGTHRS